MAMSTLPRAALNVVSAFLHWTATSNPRPVQSHVRNARLRQTHCVVSTAPGRTKNMMSSRRLGDLGRIKDSGTTLNTTHPSAKSLPLDLLRTTERQDGQKQPKPCRTRRALGF